LYYAAVLAHRKLSKEPQAVKAATDLGKASYCVSIAGIVVAVFIVLVVLIVVVSGRVRAILQICKSSSDKIMSLWIMDNAR